MDQTFSDYKLLGEKGGAFSLDDYAVIEFTGDEWKEWLQGQITNDIRLLSPENPISFCLCKPTGQILAPGTLHLVNGKGWMVVPLVCAPAVLLRVEQMVILEECYADILETNLVHIVPGKDQRIENGLPATRTRWPGKDSVEPYDGDLFTEETFLLASMDAKIPLWGFDISESNFPAEMGADFEAATMSYTKGCYTGQEVNHRLHSRGHTNKTWDVFTSTTRLENGQDLTDIHGNKIGTVTHSVAHPTSEWLVAGFVKNGTEPSLPRYQP